MAARRALAPSITNKYRRSVLSPRATRSSRRSFTTAVFSWLPAILPTPAFSRCFRCPVHHQHLLSKINPVDQNRYHVQLPEFPLAQFLQLRRTGVDEFPADAGFLDTVAVQNALHRTTIVPRAQSGDDAFPHGALPPSVVLHPRIALQIPPPDPPACAPAAGEHAPSDRKNSHNRAVGP